MMLQSRRTLEEIYLLRCSLLPGEVLEFSKDAEQCNDLLDTYALNPDYETGATHPHRAAYFSVRLENSSAVWFDVELPPNYEDHARVPHIAVKGDNLGRMEQVRWQDLVADTLGSVQGSDYPTYESVSAHLLPRLHAALDNINDESPQTQPSESPDTAPRYHALFVSHHLLLKATKKRRAFSQWSQELSLRGFARIGFPGIVYCEGTQENVEDFVVRVKGLRWKALKLRFMEALPPSTGASSEGEAGSRWIEVEKVGEVVEEMRQLGRENFVLEMGIGSSGNTGLDK